MRALLQRVSEARVRIDGEIVGEIGQGLLILFCAGREDETDAATERKEGAMTEAMTEKILNLRIFSDEAGRMNRSVRDLAEASPETPPGALVVSQFTLMADCRRGRRPGFDAAAEPEAARRIYEGFVERLAASGLPVATGRFGAMMQVELINDGPVTIMLDSERDLSGKGALA